MSSFPPDHPPIILRSLYRLLFSFTMPRKKAPVDDRKIKCCMRGCDGFEANNHPLKDCSAPKCKKQIHTPCSTIVCKKNNLAQLVDSTGNFCEICTKACYNAFKSYQSGAHLKWTNDGASGETDPNTSMKILLDWLTAFPVNSRGNQVSNYAIYRGGNPNSPSDSNRGKTKLQICEKILKFMEDAG